MVERIRLADDSDAQDFLRYVLKQSYSDQGVGTHPTRSTMHAADVLDWRGRCLITDYLQLVS